MNLQNWNNTNRRDSKLWNKDGVNGGPSSITILVLWLSEEANYRHWKGSNAGGITKETLCSEIKERFAEHGIYHCKNVGIQLKIQSLHKTYHETYQFLHATGQGIENSFEKDEMSEKEVASTIRETMIRKYQYFYDLEPVMSDRPSVIPPFPMSFNKEADVDSAFSLDTFDTFDNAEVLMNGRQKIGKSSSSAQRRPFSATFHTTLNHSEKKVCKTIDTGIVGIVRMAEDMQREKLALNERRVAIEEIRALTERIREDSESAQHQEALIQALSAAGFLKEEIAKQLKQNPK
ncbi:hypothetical protein J3Q64DRAFT_1841871 [Phycomyces blakesleeanus]|uniref:Homeodomain-like DNA binding domain-containing transcription factor n=1 Tax=Phycomyces blakesleeanus TaxID=4837 RepID=A0ABR3AHE5_PHYBL